MVFIIFIGLIASFSVFSFYKYPRLFPTHFTMDYWYNAVFKNVLFWESMFNSIIIGLLNGTFSTLVGFLAARTFVKIKMSEDDRLVYLYSLPLFLPSTALFIGIHLVMINTGAVNSYAGVILAHMVVSIPYAVNIGISFFRGIPNELIEVAKTSGANAYQRFVKIQFPLLRPGILFSIAICFLLSMSEYFSTFLIGGGNIITLSTVYYPYITNGDYGNSAVFSIVFLLINGIVFFLAEHITRKYTKIQHYLFT